MKERKFYAYAYVVTGLAIVTVVAILLSNVQGFFISPADDPITPIPASTQQAAEQGAAQAEAATGPGAKIYDTYCVACHQKDGNGLPGIYPSLLNSDLLLGEPTKPIAIVLHGFQGKIVRNGKEYNGLMTPFGGILSDEQIAQVLTHERSSWGNSAEPITAEMVAKVREMTKDRKQPFTEEELNALTAVSQLLPSSKAK